MRPKRQVGIAAATLDPRDRALMIWGPWHEEADCAASPTVLWHPRAAPARLRALWARHREAIEAEARAAGLAEPWVADRLAFIDRLEG